MATEYSEYINDLLIREVEAELQHDPYSEEADTAIRWAVQHTKRNFSFVERTARLAEISGLVREYKGGKA